MCGWLLMSSLWGILALAACAPAPSPTSPPQPTQVVLEGMPVLRSRLGNTATQMQLDDAFRIIRQDRQAFDTRFFNVADDGTVVYQFGAEKDPNARTWLLNPDLSMSMLPEPCGYPAISPSGSVIACANAATVYRYDRATNTMSPIFSQTLNQPSFIRAFERTLLVAAGGQIVIDAQTGELMARLYDVFDAAVADRGTMIPEERGDGMLWLGDLETNEEQLLDFTAVGGQLDAIAFSPDETRLLLSAIDRAGNRVTLLEFNLSTGALIELHVFDTWSYLAGDYLPTDDHVIGIAHLSDLYVMRIRENPIDPNDVTVTINRLGRGVAPQWGHTTR